MRTIRESSRSGTAYPERTYPHGDAHYAALEQDFWRKHFDTSKKVAVYWPNEADSPTLVGYYETWALGLAARTAAIRANGSLPTITRNPLHPDIARLDADIEASRDAREDLPAWLEGW